MNVTKTLPSGAKLEFHQAPWKDARKLCQALASEALILKMNLSTEIDINFFKDLVCTAIHSEKIEAAIWVCMQRALYNGLKVTEDTFEPEEARQDYYPACIEIAQENAGPFMKGLYAPYAEKLKGLIKALP